MIAVIRWGAIGVLFLIAAGSLLAAIRSYGQLRRIRQRRQVSPVFPRSTPLDESVFIYRPGGEWFNRARRLMHGTPYQRAVAYVEMAYPGMQISHADSQALGDAGLFLERELRRRGLTLVPDGDGEDLRVEKVRFEA